MNPLFGNDIVGLIKFLSIIVGVVLLPLAALVVYFLKRTDVAKEAAIQKDIDGFGGRLTAVEASVTRIGADVGAFGATVTNAQRDTMDAIRAIGEQNMRAIHGIDKEVAVLKERNDLGDCVASFGKSIERALERMDRRDPTEREAR